MPPAPPVIAVTRAVSPSLADCELTHLARSPIDVARAAAQHAGYERLLTRLGATIVRLGDAPAHPDAVFVEDVAVVLDEVAVLTRPGAASRRGELEGVGPVLSRWRPLLSLEAPATLDGGDVLRLGRTLYVGRSSRTGREGIEQLTRLVAPFDYRVVAVEFGGCLHLKTAVTEVAEGLVLVNPDFVTAGVFTGWDNLTVDVREPQAANALMVGDVLVYPSQYPRTRDALVARGLRLECLDYDELAKAEGGVTCCSLLIDDAAKRMPG